MMPLDIIKERKNLIVPVVLLTAALSLLIYNSIAGPGKRLSPISRAVLEALSYPQALVTTIASGVGNVWHRYFYLRGVEEENRQLHKDVGSLSFEVQHLRERLARMQMNLPESVWRGARLLPAKIIALPARDDLKVITINRGSSHGVKYGMPVVTGVAVVGKIVGGGDSRAVPPHSAQVLLLIDPRCKVDALVYRLSKESLPDPTCPWNPSYWSQTRVRGVVEGDGEELDLKYVERGSDVQPGDMVVSSGLGGVFPKGLLIGRVSAVGTSDRGLCLSVGVTPGVDFNTLEEIMVMVEEGE